MNSYQRWKLKRKMAKAVKQHDWKTALECAKVVGDKLDRELFALCLATRLLFGDKEND